MGLAPEIAGIHPLGPFLQDPARQDRPQPVGLGQRGIAEHPLGHRLEIILNQGGCGLDSLEGDAARRHSRQC
jgi:hypothetical protein